MHTLSLPLPSSSPPAAKVAPPARKLEWWNDPFLFWWEGDKALDFRWCKVKWHLRSENTVNKLCGVCISCYLNSIKFFGGTHNKTPFWALQFLTCIKEIFSLFLHHHPFSNYVFIVFPFLLVHDAFPQTVWVKLRSFSRAGVKEHIKSNWSQFIPISFLVCKT